MTAPNPDGSAGIVGRPVSSAPPVAPPNPDGAAGVVDGGSPGLASASRNPDGGAGTVDRIAAAPAPDADGVPGFAAGADGIAGGVPGIAPGLARDRDLVAGIVDPRVSAIPPAARRLQGQRAGLITRLVANTVDFGVAAAIVAGGYAAVAALRFLWNSRSFTFPAPSFGVLVIAGGVVMTLYLTACWAASGRTYGDHLLGLRVLGLRGRPPRPVAAFLRAVLCVVFPIGLFWIVISRDNRSVQDVLLRSSVVYDWSRTPLSGRR